MVDRIVYEDNTPEPGDLFTANDAKAIRDAVNALGTAADADTGTAPGNVPVLNGDGQIPAAMIPGGGGGGGGGSGDVSGPGTSTDGRVALFDGTSGAAIKQGAAVQTLPATATDGYWLTVSGGSLTWVNYLSLISAIGTATGSDRLDQSKIKGFTDDSFGDLAAVGLIASGGMTASQVWRTNSGATGVEGVTLGSSATLDAIPTGAPTAASSSSGAIALDYTAGVACYGTTTTENITTVTVTLTAYQWGQWIVTQTTARNITFPAGTVIFGNGGLLAYTGVANSRLNILFYKDNTTLWAIIGDAGVVGA